MIIKEGPSSHSPFKLESLLNQLNKTDPNILELGAKFIHFIDSKSEVSDEQDKILESILRYGPKWPSGPNEGKKYTACLDLVLVPLGPVKPPIL